MALGNKQKNNNKLFVIKLARKERDGGTYFKISSKNAEGKWEEEPQKDVRNVSGDIVKIDIKQGQYKDNVYDRFQIFLEDNTNQESYLLDFRLNNITRGFFNSLFSLEDYKGVTISYGENKKGYECLYVEQNGKNVDWFYKIEDQPKLEIEELKNSKGEVVKKEFDSTNLDNFYKEKIWDLAKSVRASLSNKRREAVSEVSEDGDTDQVPF
jgi:hypothetical protein